jgi:hypothetical protein
MIIDLKSINYYFLTCDTNGTRKKHMIEEFKDYKIKEVNPILGIGKCKSGSIGMSRMIDMGLKNQDRTKPFQPFIMLEDDTAKYREFPDKIEIPDDADILYIGLSKCGTNDKYADCSTLHFKEINKDVIRIYNMLALHGIIICSAQGANAIQKCMCEGYFNNKIWDLYTAYIQPYYNVYALKNPLVYQFEKIGGNEGATKFNMTETKENINIKKGFIKNDIFSVLTTSMQIDKKINIV